jgi:hypothetical protein
MRGGEPTQSFAQATAFVRSGRSGETLTAVGAADYRWRSA